MLLRATAGRAVTRGEVLVRMDEAEVRDRLEQAEAALRQARERLARTAALEQSGAITACALLRTCQTERCSFWA